MKWNPIGNRVSSLIRLAKFIADAGLCSRRAACRLIDAGGVTVNGRQGLHIDRVSEQDEVLVRGECLQRPDYFSYFLYHKPAGIDCVCDSDDPDSIVHFIPSDIRLFPVGRLDKDSRGLMLLTNHGELCQRILHPDFYHEKEYLVTVNKSLTADFCRQMSAGVQYGDICTKPCTVRRVSERCFSIILTQGLNRQIRKMCKALGFRVLDLQRVRLLDIHLDMLPEGDHRPLTPEEIQRLEAINSNT